MEDLMLILLWNLIVFVIGGYFGEFYYKYREGKRIAKVQQESRISEIERKLRELDVKARYPKGHQI